MPEEKKKKQGSSRDLNFRQAVEFRYIFKCKLEIPNSLMYKLKEHGQNICFDLIFIFMSRAT